MAGAPHVDDAGAPYPGTCRSLNQAQRQALLESGRRPCLRLRCPDGPVNFTDTVFGPQSYTLADCGRDILISTPRQIALLKLLGYGAPAYAHVPLLLDDEGERLAKRHQSLALRNLRQMGADPRRVTGLLGSLAGCNPGGKAASPAELIPYFSLSRLAGDDIRLGREMLRALVA